MRNRAPFPKEASNHTQYGPVVRAMFTYLHNAHFIPEDRIQEILKDLFQIHLATDTIMNQIDRFAQELEPIEEQIKQQILSAHIKHLDETGCCVATKTKWVHVVSTETQTYYRLSEKRGDLAHLLRELKAAVLHDGEEWAGEMRALLKELNILSKREKNEPEKKLDKEERYDALVKKGLNYHSQLTPLPRKRDSKRGCPPKRPGHNLVLRFQNFKEDILRFLKEKEVPFTNNQAEQDLRMLKVKQKISGGFRTDEGAQHFLRIRGFISTARKRGLNIIEMLMNPIQLLNA